MLVSPPSSARLHRPMVLSVVLAMLALSGCVGVVGETQDESVPSSRDAGRASKRDAKVVTAETPSESNGNASDDTATETSHTVEPAQATPTNTKGVAIDAGVPAADASSCSDAPLATGLRIGEIALYQTIKVSLYKGGTWVTTRTAPVVQNKKSMVRVFVNRTSGYQPRMLRGVLTLTDGTNSTQLTDQRMLTADSTDDQLNSTFTFQVDGAKLNDGTQFSVAIQELSCTGGTSSASDAGSTDARYPATGTRSLETANIGKLKVVVLPVSLNGRVPVTTDAELANMRAALLAYYPVPDVDISVRAPLVWSYPVDAQDGSSWSNLLNGIMAERRKDAVASNVYYFGLMQPAATFKAYCSRGCILGLAPQTTMVQPSAQIGLGASFADAQTYETMVHELGHAHGRGHSPCVEGGTIDGVDQSYPDPTGATITWGWDSRISALMPPTDKDIMGYCQPNWISQYNYSALATRSQSVNFKALVVGQKDAVRWQHVLLYANGTARWGGSTETEQPGGNVEQADVLDAQGNVIAQTEIVRVPLSHTGDEFGYIPAPEASWAALKLSDRTLVLSEILPAL